MELGTGGLDRVDRSDTDIRVELLEDVYVGPERDLGRVAHLRGHLDHRPALVDQE